LVWRLPRPGGRRVPAARGVGEFRLPGGRRGGVGGSAPAAAADAGPYGLRAVRWAHAEEGLKTIAAAAKWIGARLAEVDADAGKDTRSAAGGVHPVADGGGDHR
ncbi:hypothetical protein ABZ714_19620, partial [Streptomyces sp. NPDC006798]